MGPIACWVGVALAGGPALPSDAERQALAWVRQLGDERFDRREAAQEELARRGAAVLPVFDRLRLPPDPEIDARLERLRRSSGGPSYELRRLLLDMKEPPRDERKPTPAELEQHVRANLPQAGDWLLTIIAQPQHRAHRRAVNTFADLAGLMSADQLDAYLRAELQVRASPRPRYPQGIDATVPCVYSLRHGWGGWPNTPGLGLKTRTTHILDGQPVGRPYEHGYQSPGAATGGWRLGGLAAGRHTARAEVEYEFTHRGEARAGKVRSEAYEFEVVAGLPDDLLHPASPDLDAQVRGQFQIVEYEMPAPALWAPQVTWKDGAGKDCGLCVPVWKLTGKLPADLCFEVEIIDPKTGQSFPGDPVIVRKGQFRAGPVLPRDAPGFARGRSGSVPVKVVLKPSRALALGIPELTSYYAGTITSGEMRIKVIAGE